MLYNLRFGVFYLVFVAIAITVILLVVASATFQKSDNTGAAHHGLADWVWAMIPLMMLLVLLVPIVNLFLHQG